MVDKNRTKDRHRFFLELWDKREVNGYVICFETGKKLKRELYRKNMCCYSHILPKSKYPQYEFLEENVVIVHPDAHSQYERDCNKAPNQCMKKKELLEKHYLGKLKQK